MGNLVKCGSCGKDVDKLAEKCPGCGAQQPRHAALVLLCTAIVGVLVWYFVFRPVM